MLHLQLYYSLKRFPSALFSKTIELNPLGRWTMKRPHSINTYLASLDHEDGTLNGVRYCRKTSKSLLRSSSSSSSRTTNNRIDSLYEFILTQDRL